MRVSWRSAPTTTATTTSASAPTATGTCAAAAGAASTAFTGNATASTARGTTAQSALTYSHVVATINVYGACWRAISFPLATGSSERAES